MIIRRGIMTNAMENNRGQACDMPAKSVNIRDLENRLRDAGCSRSQSKKLVASYKALEGLSEAELRDVANRPSAILEPRQSEPSNMVDELMERINKLTH